jgi:hypothetical protein
MFSKKHIYGIALLGLTLLLAACPETDDSEGTNTVEPATVIFWNVSRYTVDVFINNNPAHFDPSTWVCTLGSGDHDNVTMYPSYDQVVGDFFYPHYNVLLADQNKTGTMPIYAEAQRVLKNIPLVIKSGGTYTETIPAVKVEELSFFHGYIIVENHRDTRIQIINGSTVLPKKDDDGIYVNAYATGYYEISFSDFDTAIVMNQLRARTGNDYILFPSLTIEKGKKYFFTVPQEGNVVTWLVKNVWE